MADRIMEVAKVRNEVAVAHGAGVACPSVSVQQVIEVVHLNRWSFSVLQM